MVTVSVLSLAIGIGAGTQIKSPEQQAAEQAPPPITTLTEPVALGTVQQTVSASATIVRQSTTPVVTKPGDVITALPTATGTAVEAGQVVLEVGGRPVIALLGPLAQYRELTPGMSGQDVTQLIAALTGLGFDVAGESTFGPATQAAVSALYGQVGYEPELQGVEELQAAESAVEATERGVRDASRAVDQAETILKRARRDLPAEAGPPEQLARKDAIADANVALEVAQEGLTDARTALERAEKGRTEAKAQAGVKIPLSELLFVPAFPATATVLSGVGPSTGGDALRLVSGPLVALSELSVFQGEDLETGMSAVVLSEDGQALPATVTMIDDVQEVDEISQQPVTVRRVLLTPDPALPDSLLGKELRVNIAASTSDEEVLHVPVTAVSSAMDGSSQVVVAEPDGTQRIVPVTTGLQGDGRIQVTSAEGDLREGEMVIIGG